MTPLKKDAEPLANLNPAAIRRRLRRIAAERRAIMTPRRKAGR